jgi:histidine triad (HIT) family protein
MASDPNCIFCKIVAGQIPCHKLHEDADVLAFLDVSPLSEGHCLIIPKAHHVTLETMPDDLAASCGRVMPALARAVLAATGASAYNVLQNNGKAAHQAVGHVHFHIIPKVGGAGLGIGWPSGKLDQDAARLLVQKITANLG